MRFIGNILLKGLAVVLPVGLTFYLVYWLGAKIEHVLHSAIIYFIPEEYYWPGMGLVVGVLLLLLVGVVVEAWVVRRLLRFGDRLLQRIPLVKSVYNTLRDFMDHFSKASARSDLKQVVVVTVNDAQLIGFLTCEYPDGLPELEQPVNTVAVYLPMSYQIGGYTVYLPRDRVRPVDLSVEDAMRRVLTAGLSKSATVKK